MYFAVGTIMFDQIKLLILNKNVEKCNQPDKFGSNFSNSTGLGEIFLYYGQQDRSQWSQI